MMLIGYFTAFQWRYEVVDWDLGDTPLNNEQQARLPGLDLMSHHSTTNHVASQGNVLRYITWINVRVM